MIGSIGAIAQIDASAIIAHNGVGRTPVVPQPDGVIFFRGVDLDFTDERGRATAFAAKDTNPVSALAVGLVVARAGTVTGFTEIKRHSYSRRGHFKGSNESHIMGFAAIGQYDAGDGVALARTVSQRYRFVFICGCRRDIINVCGAATLRATLNFNRICACVNIVSKLRRHSDIARRHREGMLIGRKRHFITRVICRCHGHFRELIAKARRVAKIQDFTCICSICSLSIIISKEKTVFATVIVCNGVLSLFAAFKHHAIRRCFLDDLQAIISVDFHFRQIGIGRLFNDHIHRFGNDRFLDIGVNHFVGTVLGGGFNGIRGFTHGISLRSRLILCGGGLFVRCGRRFAFRVARFPHCRSRILHGRGRVLHSRSRFLRSRGRFLHDGGRVLHGRRLWSGCDRFLCRRRFALDIRTELFFHSGNHRVNCISDNGFVNVGQSPYGTQEQRNR